MLNPALAALQQQRTPQRILIPDNVRKVAQALKASGNPAYAIQTLANQNPLMRQVQEIGQRYGGDYNKAFMDLCQQNGIDPNDIMAQLQGLM